MNEPTVTPYTSYEFRLVVSGLDLDDEKQLDAVLTGFDGAATVAGTTTELAEVFVIVDAGDPVAAVDGAITKLGRLLPGVVVERVDEELVSISDIAHLTERTRESIRLLADGKRGDGTFPAPVGVVGNGMRVWRWADVDAWLRQHSRYDFPTQPIPAWVVDASNASLHRASGRRSSGRWAKARAAG